MITGFSGMGIRFGGHDFSEPQLLPLASPRGLESRGLYVILVHDVGWKPQPFRPLYFGESDAIWCRATAAHENYASWRAEAGLIAPLYRALRFLPGWTRFERQAAESALISEYNPPCNKRLSWSLAGLFGVRSR